MTNKNDEISKKFSDKIKTMNTSYNGPADILSHPASFLRQRILVVDDDADIRRLNADILACHGYAVDTAEDGAAAWIALQKHRYDLVVTDYNMPKVTGVELIKQMNAGHIAVPVIMVTGDLLNWEFTEPWIDPARILLKPYNFLDLLDMVKEVLDLNTVAAGEMAPPPNWRIPPVDKTGYADID